MIREGAHVWVGAAVVLAIPVLALVFFTGDLRTRDEEGYRLEAAFGRVDGATIGSPVRVAGIAVGKVVGMRFDPRARQAVLTLSIREGLKLPTDTAALILSDGLLGSKYIKLEPGGALEYLEPGQEIQYAQGSVIVEELLEKVILWAEARRGRQGSDAPAEPSGEDQAR